jgi:NAD(P)H-hydrate epimerase
MPTIPVLTPAQSGVWDAQTEASGIPLASLMESAGRAVVSVLANRWPDRAGQGVLIAAGNGNNGGDGWVVARALHRLGAPVWVTTLSGVRSPLCHEMAVRAQREGVRELAADGPWPGVALVVDAILGTGASGAPRPPVQALIDRIAELALPVLAVDGPTGLDLLNGVSHGQPVVADITVTFGGLRRGHLLARDEVGDLFLVDIGHPPADSSWPTLLTDDLASTKIGRLPGDAHKGDRGRVVIVGGDPAMVGALRFACRAAFAAGAGLVHAVAPAASIEVLRNAEPDVQTSVQSLEGPLDRAVIDLVQRADAVVIGPGLGRSGGRREFVGAILDHARTAVIDADALTVHAGDIAPLRRAAERIPVILTPHGGEFRALFPAQANVQELDPWTAAAAASGDSSATVLLKGVPSVVARAGAAPYTIAAGNPGLATGGSGDLLSGFAGALLAQGHDAPLAAGLAAHLLGRAAEIGARRHTARALRPMDVLAAVPDLWRAFDIRRSSRPPLHPPVLLELLKPAG